MTWAQEDVDFWAWFWEWYKNFDSVWEFDHEAGDVLTNSTYEWEWFMNHTLQEDQEYIKIDTDDSEQWSWQRWNAFWENFSTIDHSKDGYMSRHKDEEQEVMEVDEDDVCRPGSYLNDHHTCLPCPMGCAHCHSMGHCFDCFDNFEPVFGPGFGFCFPKCFHG